MRERQAPSTDLALILAMSDVVHSSAVHRQAPVR